MTKFYFILLFICAVSTGGSLYSGHNADTNLSFKYNNYDVAISSSSSGFFGGRLSVSEGGKTLFSMDSSFTNYVEHKFIDLNGDGSNEMLLYLTEGASPYVFHYLYVFDSKRGAEPLYMLQNGEVDTSVFEKPLLTVNLRMSPAVLGLWYSYFLEYSDNRLRYTEPGSNRSIMLGPDFASIKENLDELNKSNEICDDFAYDVFFEYIFITSKISGQEPEAERFFNENYRCENRISALKQFKTAAVDNYSWIKNEENYKYSIY